ncbi:Rad51 protein [Spironucleus salmonicida]|uniref:Dmc1b n=1 Tax=Spironucleus salmonicida TaxID=348837 RepID=V6LQM8_9EUKA|nr:Rad51 protein [Spironucleus salmonicida]|eukprot:EST46553.1 Dmc1b [Spironucleus salmonicida]
MSTEEYSMLSSDGSQEVIKTKTKTNTKTKTATKAAQPQEQQVQNQTFQVHEIDNLTSAGIAAGDISRLKEAGIQTIEGLQMMTKKQLSVIKGISEAKVDKLISAAISLLSRDQIVTADVVLAKRANLLRLSTGSNDLDALLKGGIESMQICEVFGEFRCGKSQLCHTLAVTGQHPNIAGKQQEGAYKVVYIDTESTFRPERIDMIATRYGLDPKQVLKNIYVSRVYNHEQQMQALSLLPQLLVKDKFSIIIIDSITALFRVDFSGRGELADRQQKLGQHLSQLIKLSEEFNLVVFITNQVMSDPSGAVFVANSSKPIGGHVLSHASTTRISLRKGRGECRIAKIYDSPSLPEGEATFQITDGGIDDAQE